MGGRRRTCLRASSGSKEPADPGRTTHLATMRAQPAHLRGERVVLRPTEPDDHAALRAILATPEVADWWGPVPEGFPTDDDPAATRLSIVLGAASPG